ncbi:MAG: ABC transporter ATP-binding protein [Desulfovibrionaceae bacterium]|nr:ABC transporter ATP-binding protein [Desulfovibrionaceae bacterium]
MIEIRGLGVDLPGFCLRDVDLDVAQGEFFALLGPTGAGKSVLLEAVAGLMPLDRGSVFLNGRQITGLPPERRGLGIVYQDFALFPHLSVRDNVRFGLRYCRDRDRAWQNALGLVERLGLGPLLDRAVAGLSGGERQRVALVRSLAVGPSVLLLDEPMSALDPAFRQDVQMLLKDIHKDLGLTFIMVSHNFEDVLFLAARGAVIDQGRIVQSGEVAEIFHRPATPFVAAFVGMKNILPAVCGPDGVRVGDLTFRTAGRCSGPAHLAVRPEDIVLGREDLAGRYANCFQGRVRSVYPEGLGAGLEVLVGDLAFRVHASQRRVLENGLDRGTEVWLAFPEDCLHIIG